MATERAQGRIADVMLDPFGINVGGLGIDPERDQELPNHAMALARRRYGSARPSPRAAAWRRPATRMAFRAERRGRLRRQVWMRKTFF
jgi:hypothetical protein